MKFNIVRMYQGRIRKLKREKEAMQAKIDSLMLEYCPNEMTEGQVKEWASHQKVVYSEEFLKLKIDCSNPDDTITAERLVGCCK